MSERSRWQSVMLILSKRLECECGNLALFVVLDGAEKTSDGKEDMDYTSWCQDCFEKAQKEIEL